MNILRNANHFILLYSKSCFVKVFSRDFKNIRGRVKGTPKASKMKKMGQNPNFSQWRVGQNTFLKLQTPGFSVLHIYRVMKGSGGKFWKHFFKMGPPNGTHGMHGMHDTQCIHGTHGMHGMHDTHGTHGTLGMH